MCRHQRVWLFFCDRPVNLLRWTQRIDGAVSNSWCVCFTHTFVAHITVCSILCVKCVWFDVFVDGLTNGRGSIRHPC